MTELLIRCLDRHEAELFRQSWVSGAQRFELHEALLGANGFVLGAYSGEKLRGLLAAEKVRSLRIMCLAAENDDKSVWKTLLAFAEQKARASGVSRIKISARCGQPELAAFLERRGYEEQGRALSVLCPIDGQSRKAVEQMEACAARRRAAEDIVVRRLSGADAGCCNALAAEFNFSRGLSDVRFDPRISRIAQCGGETAGFCIAAPLPADPHTALIGYLGCGEDFRGKGIGYLLLCGVLRDIVDTGEFSALAFAFRTDNTNVSGVLHLSALRGCSYSTSGTVYFAKPLPGPPSQISQL